MSLTHVKLSSRKAISIFICIRLIGECSLSYLEMLDILIKFVLLLFNLMGKKACHCFHMHFFDYCLSWTPVSCQVHWKQTWNRLAIVCLLGNDFGSSTWKRLSRTGPGRVEAELWAIQSCLDSRQWSPSFVISPLTSHWMWLSQGRDAILGETPTFPRGKSREGISQSPRQSTLPGLCWLDTTTSSMHNPFRIDGWGVWHIVGKIFVE